MLLACRILREPHDVPGIVDGHRLARLAPERTEVVHRRAVPPKGVAARIILGDGVTKPHHLARIVHGGGLAVVATGQRAEVPQRAAVPDRRVAALHPEAAESGYRPRVIDGDGEGEVATVGVAGIAGAEVQHRPTVPQERVLSTRGGGADPRSLTARVENDAAERAGACARREEVPAQPPQVLHRPAIPEKRTAPR